MITAGDIAAELRDLGVEDGDMLFVHAGLRGALRVEGDTPAEKVATVIEALRATVGEGLLAMPTFTYSYCRGEDFDPDATPSAVGVLGEIFRHVPGVRRTVDPIFSTALLGPIPEDFDPLFAPGDTDCFGDDSVFALMRRRRARILFLGVGFEYCTYVHHVEQRRSVPYRYAKDFRGRVRTDAAWTDTTARYFVRDLGGNTEVYLDALAERLESTGGARAGAVRGGPRLLLTDAPAIEAAIADALEDNPAFLLRRGHPELALEAI